MCGAGLGFTKTGSPKRRRKERNCKRNGSFFGKMELFWANLICTQSYRLSLGGEKPKHNPLLVSLQLLLALRWPQIQHTKPGYQLPRGHGDGHPWKNPAKVQECRLNGAVSCHSRPAWPEPALQQGWGCSQCHHGQSLLVFSELSCCSLFLFFFFCSQLWAPMTGELQTKSPTSIHGLGIS